MDVSTILSDEIPFWIEFPADGKLPNGAVKAGNFRGEPLYIGRAMHKNAMTTGSVVPSERKLYLAWGYQTHKKTEFEILIGGSSMNWVSAKSGNVPENAFVSGHTEHNESTFIGRVKHQSGDIIIGKIHPSFKTCYVPDIAGTKELEFYEYEVLVV